MARRLSVAKSNETKFAQSSESIFLDCRDLGHYWVPEVVEQVARTYVETLACGRCDASKRRILDRFGYRLRGEHRTYPQGYLAQGLALTHQSGRAAVRMERMQRSLQGLSVAKSQTAS